MSPTTAVPEATAISSADVVLVSMPYGPLFTPSIGLGLLAAQLRLENFATHTLYLTLPFAKRIGVGQYAAIAAGEPGNHFLLGEWLFRDALFQPISADSSDEYLSLLQTAVLARKSKGQWADFATFTSAMKAIRDQANDFIYYSAATILAYSPRIVGFTSVFQQHVSSLAVAAEIKRRAPDVTVVFGGANCESVMGSETVRQFPQVDYVVSGEGDNAFPALVRGLLSGERQEIAGVFDRSSAGPQPTTSMVTELDKLPFPEYDPYFTQLRESDLDLDGVVPRLLFETSRGCWWGQKQHCTFCGLNGTSMAFRSKSASRALNELQWMVATYPDHSVSVVDNILDMKYFHDFVPLLAASQLPIQLFYEVKANLKKDQLRLLKQANIMQIQPGVESLHDSVLTLMRKGVSALQNIQLLKWCAELGLRPHWNLIWGFPKEDPAAYAEMTTMIPLLRHLPAPESTSCIRLDRFSPNFNDAKRLGISDVRPFLAYDFIYPFSPEVKTNLAYYFTFEYEQEQHIETYTRAFLAAVQQWQQGAEAYHFFSMELGDELMLWDFRDIGEEPLVVLTSIQKSIYLFCDTARSVPEICARLNDLSGAEERVETELDRMLKRKIMLRIGKRYLSLAVLCDEQAPHVQGLVSMQKFIEAKKLPSSTAEESVIDLTSYVLT
jgi:ribosomal peptide maturation radical SAM protein 1